MQTVSPYNGFWQSSTFGIIQIDVLQIDVDVRSRMCDLGMAIRLGTVSHGQLAEEWKG